jgi:hypothetical protein
VPSWVGLPRLPLAVTMVPFEAHMEASPLSFWRKIRLPLVCQGRSTLAVRQKVPSPLMCQLGIRIADQTFADYTGFAISQK